MDNDGCLTDREVLIGKDGLVRVFYGDHREPSDDEYGEVISVLDDMNDLWISMSRNEAIAAARAILKHFDAGMEE